MDENASATPTKKEAKGTFTFSVIAVLLAEILFLVLPFIVSGIIFTYKGNPMRLLYMPEWSLAASVLFGQALVKYISGILSGQGYKFVEAEAVGLAISILIVAGLVPSLLVLSLVLVSDVPSNGLATAQTILFILGLAAFIFFAGIGQSLTKRQK